MTEVSVHSIARVKLTDFVTYTALEFCPGPNLEMSYHSWLQIVLMDSQDDTASLLKESHRACTDFISFLDLLFGQILMSTLLAVLAE